MHIFDAVVEEGKSFKSDWKNLPTYFTTYTRTLGSPLTGRGGILYTCRSSVEEMEELVAGNITSYLNVYIFLLLFTARCCGLEDIIPDLHNIIPRPPHHLHSPCSLWLLARTPPKTCEQPEQRCQAHSKILLEPKISSMTRKLDKVAGEGSRDSWTEGGSLPRIWPRKS